MDKITAQAGLEMTEALGHLARTLWDQTKEKKKKIEKQPKEVGIPV